jgi:hypothetical protein
MGLSLTSPGLVGRADRADLDLVARVVLDPAGRADPVDLGLVGRADPVDLGLAGPHPEDPAVPAHIRDPEGLDRAARADLDPADLAVLGRVGLVVPADIRDRADPVDPDLAGRVARADLDPADRADPVDRASQVIRADRHRRHTHPGVLSTAVAPRWAARGTCRTASAHPVTARRLRPQNTDGVGMAGLRPERRRLSGTDRRPRVAGTVHRLPVVGMSDGMGHRATKALRSAISGRSTTTGTTRSRCSTQCSGDGASGSSESGFRCTDTTPKLHGLRTLLTQVRRP